MSEVVGEPLRFEILGSIRAFRDGRQLDLGPAKQRAVLAVLLLNPGRPVPTHRIVDAVWGDDPPENGTNVVQKYVAGLRRVLDPDRSPRTPGELLALTDGGYVLRVGSLDAEDFRNGVARAAAEHRSGHVEEAARIARAALDLWYGEGLAGLSGPVFESARNRLTEEHATAWESWAAIELSRGAFGELVSELSRLVQEFPLREGLRAQLLTALYRSGRQAEALAAFRDAREYFLDELGAEPGERLQEIHRRILRNEPVNGGASVVPTAPSPSPSPPLASASPPRLPVDTAAPAPSPQAPVDTAAPAPSPQPPVDTAAPASPSQLWPAVPQQLFGPRRHALPWAEVVAATLLPIMTCSLGSWIYFAYAAVQRRTWRETITAIGYLTAVLTVITLMAINPSDLDSDDFSGQEEAGILLGLFVIVTATVYGAILASHPGDNRHDRARRDLARQFALVDPEGARRAGVGRPDLMRHFDDGGLVDLNHALPQEIARLRGITPFQAHRISMDRYTNGPYQDSGDLSQRGLLPERTLRSLRPWLICLPPTPAPRQAPHPHG
ncbi:BTAD domain-containing putative transcriptional regulator [Actinoplanes sp. CA-252034]|uniref:BTAD domain-containing putative transcriptional regulator n=1 Tax=Actinoplanes sp. CA-252034 TaxID=3239906 RepID=UPI003D974764